MTETREMMLGGLSFAVPMLPLRATRRVYPLCRKITANGLVERCLNSSGELAADEGDMDDLAEVAFLCAQAAGSTITREAFDDLPIAPLQLLDAFFLARFQTGAWVPVKTPDAPKDDDTTGEGEGEASPRK